MNRTVYQSHFMWLLIFSMDVFFTSPFHNLRELDRQVQPSSMSVSQSED